MIMNLLNKILGQQAPEIHYSEEFLPRKTWCTLSHLRTNKSPFLLSYKHKINPTLYPSPLCPLCKNDEHNTSHLFNCTHMYTNYTHTPEFVECPSPGYGAA